MRRLIAVVALVLATAACGGGSGDAVGAPPAIPVAAVPTDISVGGGVTLHPNETREVQRAFRVVGSKSLAKAGRVWELRLGSQLVGLLQLTSLNDRVDTTKTDDRAAVRRQILSGSETVFDVATTPVWTAKDNGRGTYIWFGRQMLGVLQLKSTQFETDDAATEVVTALLQSPAWPELSPEAFEDDL